MNKQDVLNYASEEIRTHQKNNYFQRGYRTAMRRAYDRVKQIDEPKKAVIPQSVADWLEVCKENLAIFVNQEDNADYFKGVTQVKIDVIGEINEV